MRKRNAGKTLICIWITLILLLVISTGAAEEVVTSRIQNVSFEEGQTWTSSYTQPDQSKVPYWYTSAKEGKIELFRENTGIYIPGVTLAPAEGTYAAELNADEESTLYQILQTEPSSLYEWSLYHGSRTAQDTMALIIGPNQTDENGKCLLSKPNKAGRDQFMQMADWLKESSSRYDDTNYTGGLYNGGTPIVVYSKKFGPNGTFQDNAAGNAFSLTPSAIYTEAWNIWLMRDTCDTTGTNHWTLYGSMVDVTEEEQGSSDNAYYQYIVPAGQTNSLFGFVSVDSAKGSLTFGNFLDCVNFDIFRYLTASSTANGTATITGKDVTPLFVSYEHSVSAYVPDAVELTLTATIAPEDTDNVIFAGVFYRTSTQQPVFITNSADNWTVEEAEDRSRNYIRKLVVNSACDLHFVFVKNPMITYDANGGDLYDCGQSDTQKSVYNFQPTIENDVPVLIEPYTSHAATKTTAEGTLDPDWRFTGWMLMDDNGNVELLEDDSGEHRVACNYSFNAGSSAVLTRQAFLVIGRENQEDALPEFVTGEADEEDGKGNTLTLKRWSAPDAASVLYDDHASGLTFIAQWRWRQTYTPMLKHEGGYERSSEGGYIDVSVKTTDENGETVLQPAALEPPEGDGISRCYFAEMQDTMSVTATANPGFEFEGWYDPDGNLVSTKNTLSYVVGKGDVKVYEARFSGTAKQRYIRQIPDENGDWIEVPEGANVPVLDHTGYEVSPGTAVTCTTGESTEDYAFEGWYEIQNGEYVKVSDSMVTPDGLTLSYVVTGNATYYARFVPRVKFEVRYVDANGIVTPPPVPGETYGTVSQTEAAELPGTPISSTASPATGYRFVGWYDGTDEDKNDATYSTPMPPVGTTYYAMFTAGTAGTDSSYTVQHIKVKPNGNTKVYSEASVSNATTGTEVTAEPTSIPGYTYRADSFTVNGTDYVSNPTGIVRGDGKLVLKLYYTPQNTPYRIEYYKLDTQGKETLADTESLTAQTDAAVSVTGHENKYQSEGYSFAAHYGKNLLTGIVTADPTLVLKVYYQPKPCTVIFKMHGHGVQVPNQTVAYGQKAQQLEDPAELGYVFGGWYTDENYTTLYDFDTPVTQDIVEIHAKWNKLWPVDFDMQGHGEQVPMQKVEDGRFATRPMPYPTAEGYVFKGWYTDASCQTEYSFETLPIKASTTIYAKWTANVTVTKVWEGGSAAEVQVRLLKDGQPYDSMPESDPDSAGVSTPQTCEQLLNTTNSWTHTWTNLPADSTYTVEEVAVPEDCTAVYEKVSTNIWKITNVRDKQGEVCKYWSDEGNQDGLRPQTITLHLYAEGIQVSSLELTAENGWSGTFGSLPVYVRDAERMGWPVPADAENPAREIRYTLAEEEVPGYTFEYEQTPGGFMVTNTHEPACIQIPVKKIWDDSSNEYKYRPEAITVRLLANDKEVDTLVLTKEDGWHGVFMDKPVNLDGEPIVYTLIEDEVKRYKTAITGSAEEGFTVRNALIYGYDFSFTKLWQDHREEHPTPQFILYNPDGTVYRTQNQPPADRGDGRYVYSLVNEEDYYVVELPMEGYYTEYVNQGEAASVTDRAYAGGTIINIAIADLPPTGDSQNLWGYLLLLAGSVTGLILLRRRKE